MILLILIFMPMLLALVLYLLKTKKIYMYFVVLQSLISLCVLLLAFQYGRQLPYAYAVGQWPVFAAVELYVGPLQLIFLGLVSTMTWLILCYNYIAKKDNAAFLLMLMFLQASLFAFFMVHDLFSMFIMIELASIISSIFIGYKRSAEAIRAAIYYLLINGFAVVFFLLAILFLYMETGSLNLSSIFQYYESHTPTSATLLSLIFILITFSIKSGIFPCFSWLPYAHASAPSSISALLSGLMIKMGFYVLFLLKPLYRLFPAFNTLFILLGLITFVLGFLLSIRQKEIKRLLAYSTISQMGLLWISLSSQNLYGSLGGIVHTATHFFAKAGLFLAFGILIERFKEKNIYYFRSLISLNKSIGFLVLYSALSITGFPFTLGYLSKMLIFKGDFIWPLKPLFYILNFGTFLVYFQILKMLPGHTFQKLALPKSLAFIPRCLLILSVGTSLATVLFLSQETQALTQNTLVKDFAVYGLYSLAGLLLYRQNIQLQSPRLQHAFKETLIFNQSIFAIFIYLSFLVFLAFFKRPIGF